MRLALNFREWLPPVVRDELDQLVATITTAYHKEHTRDDEHLSVSKGAYPLFDVRAYGANGDGVADNTVALRAAVADAAPGGTVFIPPGVYRCAGTIIVPSGVRFEGVSSRYRGSRLQYTGTGSLFHIGEGISDCGWRNLSCQADTLPGFVPKPGVYCFSFAGTAPNSSYRFSLEHLMLVGWDRGISVVGGGSPPTWQCDDVLVNNISIIESNTGVYFSTDNGNFWQFNTCRFSCVDGAGNACISVVRGGNFTLVNCTGAGTSDPTTGTVFIKLNGVIQGCTLINTQAEQIKTWLDLSAASTQSYANQITLMRCTVDAPIELHQNCRLILVGNLFNEDVHLTDNATDVLIQDIGNQWGSFYIDDSGLALPNTTVVSTNRAPIFPTYGATVPVTPKLGSIFNIIVTDTNAFTVSSPTTPFIGQRITVRVINANVGTIGAITWGAAFHLAGSFTAPANGQYRSVDFEYTGLNGGYTWAEVSRTAADATWTF